MSEDDKETKINNKFELIVSRLNTFDKQLDLIKREQELLRTLCTSSIKRLDSLEHPCMNEPLKQFQKLRKILQEVDKQL